MRVDAAKLDDLINLIGELVLERNRLPQLSRDLSSGRMPTSELSSSLGQSAARLSFITEELQSAGLKTRMVPIETVFRNLPRLVRDVSGAARRSGPGSRRRRDRAGQNHGRADRRPASPPVRNSLDHAIEAPTVREKVGKPRRGTIRLEARQEGDQIVISIGDDGAGMASGTHWPQSRRERAGDGRTPARAESPRNS